MPLLLLQYVKKVSYSASMANQLQIYKKIAITRRFCPIFRKREKDFAKELFIFYENSIFAKIVGVYSPN